MSEQYVETVTPEWNAHCPVCGVKLDDKPDLYWIVRNRVYCSLEHARKA